MALLLLSASFSPPVAKLDVPDLPLTQPLRIDGIGDDDAWQLADPTTVFTQQADNGGRVIPVEVRALRQELVVHFLFSWPDTEPSYAHLPLIKTENGWRVQQDGFAAHDERLWYEDKFAVMFARGGRLAGDRSIHFGAGEYRTPPLQSARGLHYSSSGELLDVWHWKAVRNHEYGVLDDSHFNTAYPRIPGESRYAGGYRADPSLGGGYTENWAWFNEDIVVPKRLPVDVVQLEEQQSSLRVGSEPAGISWYESEPYAEEKDVFPIGTVLPSVLWLGAPEGDRGDVRAAAQWRDGRWTLEAARAMRAESAFDVDIVDGTYLWVAVFDHSQTRHSYHLRPLQIRFR